MRSYYKAQGMFGIPKQGECEYSTLLDLDLASIVPSVAGPKRPQDRIELPKLKNQFLRSLAEAGCRRRLRKVERRGGAALFHAHRHG